MEKIYNLPDTIYNPQKFFESPPAQFDGTFDWSWTKGCFGDTKITPMDLDGIVERKGKFLVFETKNIGIEIPTGQLITLQQLVRTRLFTVMIIWGKKSPEKIKVLFHNGSTREYHGIDEARNIVTKWFKWANK